MCCCRTSAPPPATISPSALNTSPCLRVQRITDNLLEQKDAALTKKLPQRYRIGTLAIYRMKFEAALLLHRQVQDRSDVQAPKLTSVSAKSTLEPCAFSNRLSRLPRTISYRHSRRSVSLTNAHVSCSCCRWLTVSRSWRVHSSGTDAAAAPCLGCLLSTNCPAWLPQLRPPTPPPHPV